MYCTNCTGSDHTIGDCPNVCENCGNRTSPKGRGKPCTCPKVRVAVLVIDFEMDLPNLRDLILAAGGTMVPLHQMGRGHRKPRVPRRSQEGVERPGARPKRSPAGPKPSKKKR